MGMLRIILILGIVILLAVSVSLVHEEVPSEKIPTGNDIFKPISLPEKLNFEPIFIPSVWFNNK
jgi:hypothetical protein